MNALRPWPQNQVERNPERSPHAPPSSPHNGLQTQEYGIIEGVPVVESPHYGLQTQEYGIIEWVPVVDQHSFWLNAQMAGIRQEAMEAYDSNNEIDPVPDSAYAETLSLLKQMPRNVPMPDIMWSEDGGIGLEWRPENGIVTMSLYGDNHVIYGAFFGDKREVEGICTLSDTALLQGFLTTLRNLYQ